MAHADLDQVLARYGVRRNVTLSMPGFHVLPMIILNSDHVAIVPGMLAEAYETHVSIRVLPMPVPLAPFDLRIYWHERYHHDAALRWLRKAFVDLFRRGR